VAYSPELIDLLDRNYEFARAAKGREFVVRLLRFLDFLAGDVRLSVLVEDMVHEVTDTLSLFAEEHKKRQAACKHIGNNLAKKVPATLTAGKSDADELWSKQTFDKVVKAKPDLGSLPETLKDDTPVAKALWILGIWAKDYGERSYKTTNQDDASKLGDRIGAVREQQETAWQHLIYASSALGGASWSRLLELRGAVVPNPSTKWSFPEALMRYVNRRTGIRGPLVYLFSGTDDDDKPADGEIESALALARVDLERLYHEVRSRIGQRRSLLALFHRFKQRAEWYDAARLRALVAKNSRKGEDLLSLELAHFLFDHGLNPLVRAMMGDLQPDIVDLGTPRLYVESKRYSTGKRGYLIRGMHQVWDTLGTQRGTAFECRRAFYSVFRLGGPRYVFPPILRSEGAEVYPILIDIGAPKTKGSKQTNKPIVIPEADLLPE
jgi:hypothetical protein